MEKIKFEEFANECKKLQGKNVCVNISKVLETSKLIKNAQVLVNLNRLIISNDRDNEISINANYISNYYKENNALKFKLDNEIEVSICEIEL